MLNDLPPIADSLLEIRSAIVDDLEKVLIAQENRLRQMTRTASDSDGRQRGFGLPPDHADVRRLALNCDVQREELGEAIRDLEWRIHRNPLYPWIKAQKGIGDKQGARLLAAIGDPYWHVRQDRPRTVSELWAYSGLHTLPLDQTTRDTQVRPVEGGDPGHPDQRRDDTHSSDIRIAAKRQRGHKLNWSVIARMRVHLVAESCIKANGPYRAIYDGRRDRTEQKLHEVKCLRCGPSGKPALPGSPWSKGHQHQDALRILAKEVLKDLWKAAREIHERDQ
jgi:hypothetical protein